MAATSAVVRTTRRQVTFRSRAVEIGGYRELLVNLVRKELKVRYKNSVLGFVWTLINPAITIAVYAVIFGAVFKSQVPAFVLFLMSGVLIFNMFSTALSSSVGSVVTNAPLVKKVWFPREILPLASIGAAIIDFLLQSSVLIAAVVIADFTVNRWQIEWRWLPLLPAALVTAIIFSLAVSLWLAAVNVRYRDTQHFLGIALMVWFWATPIIYSINQVAKRLGAHGLAWLPYLNPFTPVVLSFQRALYGVKGATVTSGGHPVPVIPSGGYPHYLGMLAAVVALSLALLLFTARKFRKLEGDFAEAL